MRASFAVAAMLLARSANAQGNFRATPSGGRSALMGGTGVALGTDGAAPLLDPATLVRIDALLAVSVNILAVEVTNVAGYEAPGGAAPAAFGGVALENTSVSKVSANVVPSTLCVFLDAPKLGQAEGDRGKQKFGACFGTTDSDHFDFIGRGYHSGTGRVATEVQSVSRSFSRFVLAPTYAVYLTDAIAFGASLHFAFTNASAIVAQSTTVFGQSAGVISTSYASGLDGTAFGLSPLFGVTLRADKWTVGAAFQTADLTISGSAHASETVANVGSSDYSSTYAGDGAFRAEAPWRFSLGLGREFGWGAAEIDLGVGLPHEAPFYVPTSGTRTVLTNGMASQQPAGLTLVEPKSAVLSAGIGAEVFTSRSVSVLGGAALSATFNDTPGGVLPSRQTRVATSLGLGSHGEGGDLLAGVEVSYERGQTLAVNGFALPPSTVAVDMDGVRTLFVLAGTTSLRALRRAVTDVVIDPVKREQERIRDRQRPKP